MSVRALGETDLKKLDFWTKAEVLRSGQKKVTLFQADAGSSALVQHLDRGAPWLTSA